MPTYPNNPPINWKSETEKAAVVAPTKSGWASTINWAQIIGVAASLATTFGYTVPPDLIPAVVTGISTLVGIFTVIKRTWFTTAITKESATYLPEAKT